ncbi:MAG: DUF2846 domain-containing protein [Saccharospirillaceae bacterium]|nr:DUF2846 domain-containing protein [Saccharospirillaceae bacterium]
MIKKLSVSGCILALLALSGCTIHQSIGDNFGSYVAAPDGQNFKPVSYRWDYENTALLYVYRPATEWSMDELETPSFNVNGERLFNIKGGGYTWYEMEPGSYDIVVRRGIFGLEGIEWFEIKRIAEIAFEAKAGKVYYLRYSEIDPPVIDPDLDEIPLGDGPLQLVAPSRALAELGDVQMIHRGRGLLAALEVETSEDLQNVFDASLDDEEQGPATNEASPASGASNIKARPRTKEEEWWPF